MGKTLQRRTRASATKQEHAIAPAQVSELTCESGAPKIQKGEGADSQVSTNKNRYGRQVLDPTMAAGVIIHACADDLGHPDPVAVVDELVRQVKVMWTGDLR